MISLVLFLVILFVSFKTKPDSSSFRSFLSNLPDGSIRLKTIAEPNSLLGSLLSVTGLSSIAKSLPDFKCHDCLLFTIATLDDGSQFVGVWNTWMRWSGPTHVQEEQQTLQQEMTAESEIQHANKLKLSRDYKESAKGFIKASELYLRAGGPINVIEATRSLEEASKCFKASGDEDAAYKTLTKAADMLIEIPNTISKAAHLYQSIAEYQSRLGHHETATSYYLKALQGLEASGETCNFSLKAALANSYAMQRKYENAVNLYKILSKDCTRDSALRFSISRYLFAALLASFASGNIQKTVGLLQNTREEYPSFDGSQEHLLILSLMSSYQEGDFHAYNERLDYLMKKDFGTPWIHTALQTLRVDPSTMSYR